MAMKDRALIAAGLGWSDCRRDLLREPTARHHARDRRSHRVACQSAYVLVPVLLISAALIGVRVFRRRPTAPHAQTRGPRTDEKIMNDCCAQKDKGDDLAVIAAAPAMTPPRESNHGIARLRRL